MKNIIQWAEKQTGESYVLRQKQDWCTIYQGQKSFLKINHEALNKEPDILRGLPIGIGPKLLGQYDPCIFIVESVGDPLDLGPTQDSWQAFLHQWQKIKTLSGPFAHMSAHSKNIADNCALGAENLLHQGHTDIYDRVMRTEKSFAKIGTMFPDNCFDHGDMHFGNACFRKDECILIDWAETTPAPPLLTLAATIISTHFRYKISEKKLIEWSGEHWKEMCGNRNTLTEYERAMLFVPFYQFAKLGIFSHPDFFKSPEFMKKVDTLSLIMEDAHRAQTPKVRFRT